MKPQPTKKRAQQTLLQWFSKNRRDLPWRSTNNSYLIAVSEVMLQQTQVDRVIPKFIAWRRAWPTTKSLAQAPLIDVLRMWSGLGYNSRAKRLRDAAQVVMEKFHGRWPKEISELESLPGFGPYTSRAVAIFSKNEQYATIDTNVRRVITRIFFGNRIVSEKKLQKKVVELVPLGKSAVWHGALMDFGSAVCTSRNPKCEACPMKSFCLAYPAVLRPQTKKKTSSASFQDSDRYWRGKIIRLFLRHGSWSTKALIRSLQATEEVDNQRVVRLLKVLVANGLIQQQRQLYKISV